MKTDPELDQLADILKAIAAGADWDFSRNQGDDWFAASCGHTPQMILRNGWKLRLKPFTLPPPPEGRAWHRASEWKADMLQEGERPLLAGENYEEGDFYRGEYSECWQLVDAIAGCSVDKWPMSFAKTSRPLPQKIPLTAADVPQGSVIRGAGETHVPGWCMITSCSLTGVRIWRQCDPDNQREITWQELMDSETEIKRLTDTEFQPCWKFKV